MTGKAQDRWSQLDGARTQVLKRARDCASLTIPALLPPEGANQNTKLPTPYQSLGARGVNNLASKLLLALLPANAAFFRLTIDEAVLEQLGANNSAVEEAFAAIEKRVIRRIEASNLRSVLHQVLKHLIVTGNALLHIPLGSPARMFRLNQYVVLRDAAGQWTELVIREEAAPETLPEKVRKACNVSLKSASGGRPQAAVIFTHATIEPGGQFIRWHQEINGIEVPDSQGRVPVDESPFIVLRWQAVENEDYGRGHVEELMGDLISAEGLSKAILQFAAAASKILFIRRPNAVLDEDEACEAESGQFITGLPEDVSVLQLEKYADFQVAKATLDEVTNRLSHSFLLQSGTVRDAERVTAEEIRLMAQELEDVLGGVYTVLAQELQLPLVRRLMVVMRNERLIPSLPKINGQNVVEPVIVTGFDALGRGHELNRFRAFFADFASMVGPETAIATFSPDRLARKLSIGHGVDIEDVLLTDEEKQQLQMQNMGAVLLDKASGPVAGAVAKGMMENNG